MDFRYGTSFGVQPPDAYERLLLDSMRGDATLFTRSDEIEQAWDLMMPILEAWSGPRSAQNPIVGYEAGLWGPEKAEQLIGSLVGTPWRRL